MLIEKPIWGPGPETATNDKLNQMVEYADQQAGLGGGGSGGGIGESESVALVSSSLAPSAADTSKRAVLARVFTLSKVATSRAAWVRLYATDADRTADLTRGQNDDPAEGVVIALEFKTTASRLTILTPNVIVADSQAGITGLPATIINLGATGTVTTTFDFLPLQNYAA